jgi:hypothetical protein
MEQMDASGAPAMSLTYKNIKPATEVSDALFEYKPGPDVEVIDLMDALNDALPTPTPPPARRR